MSATLLDPLAPSAPALSIRLHPKVRAIDKASRPEKSPQTKSLLTAAVETAQPPRHSSLTGKADGARPSRPDPMKHPCTTPSAVPGSCGVAAPTILQRPLTENPELRPPPKPTAPGSRQGQKFRSYPSSSQALTPCHPERSSVHEVNICGVEGPLLHHQSFVLYCFHLLQTNFKEPSQQDMERTVHKGS
jgi:hypothetical protein